MRCPRLVLFPFGQTAPTATADDLPFASTSKLTELEVDALVEAIQVCVAEGLAYERGLTEMSSSAV